MEKLPLIDVTINQVLTGKISTLGSHGVHSAIGKTPSAGPLRLTTLGFAGDEQADRRYHGGPEKALHHFPAEHYRGYAERFPGKSFAVGGFGENLSSSGIVEADICLGDIFSLGSAIIQLSQGRQPCWKLNLRFGIEGMAGIVQETGWTGWYYRVLEEGSVSAGDHLRLTERPYPQANLARVQHVLYQAPLDLAKLREIADLPPLPPSWRQLFLKRLETGHIEDTRSRLKPPGMSEERG